MKFNTDLGYAFMHLYLTLHPKKSPAYDPTEEGYISDEEESGFIILRSSSVIAAR